MLTVCLTDTESMETQYIHACMPFFSYALELILCKQDVVVFVGQECFR